MNDFKIDYTGQFWEFSYLEIVTGAVDEKFINEKIIILGNKSMGISDYHRTPISDKLHAIYVEAFAVKTLLEWYGE